MIRDFGDFDVVINELGLRRGGILDFGEEMESIGFKVEESRVEIELK